METVESASPEETERLAARVAATLAPGDVVTVEGELGSGKTTFVRGAARALGVTGPVTSPTYTIGHRYEGRVPVAGDLDRVPFLLEALPDEARDLALVLDHQDAHVTSRPRRDAGGPTAPAGHDTTRVSPLARLPASQDEMSPR